MKSLFGVYTCLSTLINPLLCLESSYSNLQETFTLVDSRHPAALFVDAMLKRKSLRQWQQHQLVKRQNSNFGTPEDEAYCNARINDAYCSTGLAQADIEIDWACGMGSVSTIEQARQLANDCAKNEHGDYCQSAFLLFDVNNTRLTNIEGNCLGVVMSESCPTACRTLLEDFSSRLGCCINTYVNGSQTQTSSASVDYRVWNLCGVPLPAADCGNTPTINPPDIIRQCTSEEYFNRIFAQNVCLPERGQPYIDAIVLDSRCNQTDFYLGAEYLTNYLCSMDDKGTLCVIRIDGESADIVESLDSICATSNVSCTSNCREGINRAKNFTGCCLNSFNSSRYNIPGPPSLSYGVWKSCGVGSPGFCASTLSLSAAMSIMEENHLYILFIIISGLITQYINLMSQ